jgi:hypothetical protein
MKDNTPHLVFTPTEPGHYSGEIFSGNDKIADLPVDAQEPVAQRVVINSPASVALPVDVLSTKDDVLQLKSHVTDSTGNAIPSIVELIGDEAVIKFKPKEIGPHIAQFTSPTGDSIAQIPVEVTPPLTKAVVGNSSTVDVPLSLDSGSPQALKAVVQDPAGKEVPATVQISESGEPQAVWIPKVAGPHKVIIKDENTGEIVEIPVTAEHKAIATKPAHIAIPETAEPGKISAIVKDPTGKTVPCKVTGNNKPVVEFTPTAVGPHLVEVLDDKLFYSCRCRYAPGLLLIISFISNLIILSGIS